jgi:hypothetical protein
MRSSLPLLALTFALAACASKSSLPPSGTTRQVAIQVSCDDHSITFSVAPWTQHLNRGDEVSWTLSPASNTQDVTIDAVRGDWAFNDPPPIHAKPNTPGHVGHMKTGLPHPATYHYSIEADCQNGAGPKIHGKIDPDMIID